MGARQEPLHMLACLDNIGPARPSRQPSEGAWERDFCGYLDGWEHHSESLFAASVAKVAHGCLEIGPRLSKSGVAERL